jgi:hypothetical protein
MDTELSFPQLCYSVSLQDHVNTVI